MRPIVQRGLPREERLDPEYLGFVRRQPCCVCRAAGPSEAHHYPHKKMGGGGDWHDRLTAPLCRTCHSYWHEVGRGAEALVYQAQALLQLAWHMGER